MTIRGTGVRGFAKGKAFVVHDYSKRNPFEGIPKGSILVAATVSLSDSALIDFKNVVGIVTSEDDKDGQVCVIARGMGIPALVGISECMFNVINGDRLLIQNFDLLVNPDLQEVNDYETMRAAADTQLRFDF